MSQIDFIKYELATGKIISTYSCPEYAYASNTPPSVGIGYLSGAVNDPGAYYIVGGEILERPSLNLPNTSIQIEADGMGSFHLQNLPQGTIVTISPDGESHEINDGELSFVTENPGTYTFYINAFPYKQTTVTIEAIS